MISLVIIVSRLSRSRLDNSRLVRVGATLNFQNLVVADLVFECPKSSVSVFLQRESIAGTEAANIKDGLDEPGNALRKFAGDVEVHQRCNKGGVGLKRSLNDFNLGATS